MYNTEPVSVSKPSLRLGPATKETFQYSDSARVWTEINYKETPSWGRTMVDRSGGTRQTRGEMKIKPQKCFSSLFPSKTVHRLPFCHQPSSFPSWQSRSALAPRLASPIRAPQVPYSRVLGPTTPATRRNHQQTRNNAASIDMAIVMRIIGKFDRKILVAFHPSIMATERSKGAPGGRFVRPKPLPRPPKSTTVRIYMYIKTW